MCRSAPSQAMQHLLAISKSDMVGVGVPSQAHAHKKQPRL